MLPLLLLLKLLRAPISELQGSTRQSRDVCSAPPCCPTEADSSLLEFRWPTNFGATHAFRNVVRAIRNVLSVNNSSSSSIGSSCSLYCRMNGKRAIARHFLLAPPHPSRKMQSDQGVAGAGSGGKSQLQSFGVAGAAANCGGAVSASGPLRVGDGI
jgi:hypothetical protein